MGELKGKQIQPRDIAAGLYEAGFTDAKDLSDAVKICLSESQGYDRAYNDNVVEGVVKSRDVGLMQINIPASQIGTQAEEDLYDHATNFARAYSLFKQRGFQPWVGFTTNVYVRDTYLKRANKGVANFLADLDLNKTTDTLSGNPYVHSLTTPVVDYMYRVTDSHNLFIQLKTALAVKTPVISTLKSLVTKGLNVAKS